MKVVLITNNLFMFYKFRKELVRKLCGNCEVVMMLPLEDEVLGEIDFSQHFIDMGCRLINVEMHRRGMNPFHELKLILNYRQLLKQEKPDIVVTYSIKPNIYAGFLCSLMKIPYCANVTGLGTAFEKSVLAPFAVRLYRAAFRRVKTVFFENDSNRQFFISGRMITEEKTCLLPGAGVNLDEFGYAEFPRQETTKFVFVGRVMKEKGVEELFEAASRLQSEGAKTEVHIVGPLEDDYREKVQELADRKIIVYHGLQKDVRPFLKAANCLVLPSWHEGMANTILEASATGRPVIATNIPGCRESVVDGRTGFLTVPRDAVDLYRKMKLFMELPNAEQKEMGIFAREKMEHEFGKDKVVEKTVEAILRKGS
ncbi:MAG: glycosyltransferase family 4 protein [Eubacteriales bacterium]|nr:glycosyltransferase family 4 protein [Eubacteriales bacterium]